MKKIFDDEMIALLKKEREELGCNGCMFCEPEAIRCCTYAGLLTVDPKTGKCEKRREAK